MIYLLKKQAFSAILDNDIAVSYTHLDVYKRQVLAPETGGASLVALAAV